MSLRARVIAVVVLVALLPVPIVLALGVIGRTRESDAESATREAVVAASREPVAACDAIAREHEVRVRVIASDGSVLGDCDRDPRVASYGGVTSMDLGDPVETADAESLRGPLADRAIVHEARAGRASTTCVQHEGGALFVCESAAVRPDGSIVHAQRSARSAAQRLTAASRPLAMLTLAVLLSGLLLAGWLIVRIVGPLESLRAALVSRSREARLATQPLALAAPPEIGAVVAAHNGVLATLEAERSAREVLAADLVHELKSPLSAIRIALDRSSEDDAPSMAAREAVRRIDHTVGMLLELSRAEAGLAEERREAASVRAIVEGVIDGLVGVPGPTITLVGEEASALVAPAAIARTISCLVENARAFAKTRVEVRVRAASMHVQVEVSDDGPGVPPQLQARVFERFFSARRDAGGTGVGLALARAVAEAHGGTLTLRSEPGEGATFALSIPRSIPRT